MAEMHPIQAEKLKRISSKVTMAAYEVYSAVYGPQEALITGGCRGGFGTAELIGFLYARAFPRAEWTQRIQEAWLGLEKW